MNHKSAGRHGIILKGMLELFALSECGRRPCSGKDIVDRIERYTGGFWRPSPGSVYPVLRRLEEKGAVKAELEARNGEGKREIKYKITTKGKQLLDGEKGRFGREIDETLNAINPLFFRIIYGFEDEEIKDLRQFLEKLSQFKRDLALVPPKVRIARRREFFDLMDKGFDRIRGLKA